MKFSLKFLLLIFLSSNVLSLKLNEQLVQDDRIGNDISEVVTRISKDRVGKNGIYTIIEIVDSKQSQDFKNIIIKNLSPFACVRSELLTNLLDMNKRKRRFVITAIETFHQFLEFHSRLDDNFSFGGLFILVMLKGRIKETRELLDIVRESKIFHFNIIYENEQKEIVIETFMPFTSTTCDFTNLAIINKFINGKFERTSVDFFPNKIPSIFGCPVKVATAINAEPYVLIKKHQNGTFEVGGRDIKLLEVIADKLNFKIVYSHIEDEGYLFSNGSAGGILKRLLDNETEIIIADFWLKANRLKFFKALTAYSFENLILVIPPGREYESYEKIILPLSKTTWIYLLAVLGTGIFVILIIKKCPTEVKHFVFGTKVRNPYFNLLINLIGGVQHKLPRRNFARFILTNFVIFSLVIRTVYLGSYFNVLHSHKGHPEIQSIDEMLRKKFTMVMLPVYNDLYSEDSKVLENTELAYSSEENLKIMEEVATFRQNTAVLGGQSHITYLNQLNSMSDDPEKRKIIHHICKERLMVFSSVIYATKHFYLSDSFDSVIEILKASGLIDYWHKQSFIKENYQKRVDGNSRREVIKFKHVKGPFQILFISFIVATTIFWFECFYFQVQQSILIN